MSQGYNVTTPSLFTVRDPQELVQHNLARLNATFTSPERTSIYDTEGYVDPYNADDLIGGYIIRRGVGDWDDYLDSASNIMDALRRKLWSISNSQSVPVGLTFSCVYLNDANDWIWIYGNDGTNVSDPRIVLNGNAVKLVFTVVDTADLGDGHSDQIDVEVCGGAYNYLLLSSGSDAHKAKITAHEAKREAAKTLGKKI